MVISNMHMVTTTSFKESISAPLVDALIDMA